MVQGDYEKIGRIELDLNGKDLSVDLADLNGQDFNSFQIGGLARWFDIKDIAVGIITKQYSK
ncbi:MAG: hypothetical protein COV67_05805 [Nitrospinae bacterium CG11_big_fil_rev_8_21_14_0_20_56_8]|nr:MAG: hypothetical protein COV67_05805 [Nitrospinae bacterium CG11_big_fil_rev_8_21_14_0_20_56_8]